MSSLQEDLDLPCLLCFGWQRPSEQYEAYGTDKPDGPEPHNGLLYCYEGTNITGEKVVNPYRTQLIDALIESYEKAFALTIGIARSPAGLATTER